MRWASLVRGLANRIRQGGRPATPDNRAVSDCGQMSGCSSVMRATRANPPWSLRSDGGRSLLTPRRYGFRMDLDPPRRADPGIGSGRKGSSEERMADPTVYGPSFSTYARTVRLVLEEKGV